MYLKGGVILKYATRLIIEDENGIWFIKRRKKINGKIEEFYVLPGGMLDEGEDYITAGIREAYEELSIKVKVEEFFAELYVEELDKFEKYYFAKTVSGKPKCGTGEEFKNQSIESKYGTYEVVRLNKLELGAYRILPVSIKDKLVATYV